MKREYGIKIENPYCVIKLFELITVKDLLVFKAAQWHTDERIATPMSMP